MRRVEQVAHRLRFRDVRVLQVVFQCGSMAKAAEQLAMSQPAVSKAVADMERTIGASLFDRGARGAQLTRYGLVLLERGQAILDELKQGLAEIDFLADPTAGEVSIGSTEPMTAIVAAVIERMSRAYPRVVFNVTAADTNLLHRHLRERSIDVAITRMVGTDTDDDFDAEILFDDPLVVVAGKLHPMVRRRNISLRELTEEKWILGPSNGFLGPFIQAAFAEEGLQVPQARVISTSTDLRNNLLNAGRYLTVLPAAMLRFPRPHPSLRALAVPMASTRRPIGIVKLRNRHLNPIAAVFASVAREVAEELPRRGEVVTRKGCPG